MTRWTEADVARLQARCDVSLSRPRPRYTARREFYDGVWFGSQAELRHYKDLKLMQAAGEISDLNIHPRYDLHVYGKLLGYIELDFYYLDHASRKYVYVDVKDRKKNTSTRTPIYLWKRRHLEAEHGIVITEVVS